MLIDETHVHHGKSLSQNHTIRHEDSVYTSVLHLTGIIIGTADLFHDLYQSILPHSSYIPGDLGFRLHIQIGLYISENVGWLICS